MQVCNTMGVLCLIGILCIGHLAGPVIASQRDHKYVASEQVKLYVNKVGPLANPQETYNYYFLPFCKPFPRRKPEHAWGGLGEVLQGNELINSQVDIKFQVPITDKQVICSQTLDAASAHAFQDAVLNQYWYEFFLDDLPIWGFVGEVQRDAGGKDQAFIFTHKTFNISYNKDRIIHVNLTNSNPVQVAEGTQLTFTYTVNWMLSDTPFRQRFSKYLDYAFFEHKIHWFSIINSFIMVLFLTGLVAVILMRTLRKDYARYARLGDDDLESLEADLAEHSGWKTVHGDVFRPPRHLVLLTASVGTGCQLALLSVFVVVMAILGKYFEERGTILTAFIVCYALSGCISGYISAAMYARHEGKQWIQTMLLTAGLFPGVCFGIALCLNTIAIFYHSLAAVPFGYILLVILLWSFISFPLCLIGTLAGRSWSGQANNPCRVRRIPSAIPDKGWYLRPWVIMCAGGLLPFGSIFIELYFIFTSFWNYKVYYVFEFMLLVLLMLLVVTACVTVVGTYFMLNAENWQWQWTSFGMAASTSVYVFVYAIQYFLTKTKMTGLFQTCFYMGYTAMFCIALGLLCGAVGHVAASIFIRTIYRNVKCE